MKKFKSGIILVGAIAGTLVAACERDDPQGAGDSDQGGAQDAGDGDQGGAQGAGDGGEPAGDGDTSGDGDDDTSGGATNAVGTSDGGANTIDTKNPDAPKDSGKDAQCPTFEACGGNPVGNWRFTGLCFIPNPPASCPGMAVTGSGTAEGTYSVSSQQTTAHVATEAILQVTLPISCLVEIPCSDVFAGFGSSVGAAVEAVESSGFCVVTIRQPRYENEITRSITIEETEFVDEIQRETAFCQDDEQLRIKELDDNPFGITYTLQRQ